MKVYDFALREGYADAALIAKWKKVREEGEEGEERRGD